MTRKPRAPRVRRWSHRLPDGRLRVQCRSCFDAGLPAAMSPTHCPTCQSRAAQKRAEMVRFRQSLPVEPAEVGGAEPPPQPASSVGEGGSGLSAARFTDFRPAPCLKSDPGGWWKPRLLLGLRVVAGEGP